MSRFLSKLLCFKEKYLFNKKSNNDAYILWALAWPPVILNILRIGNSILDIKSVGYLHTAALTAVGSTFTITMLIYAMSSSMGISASAIISRAFGAKNREEYTEAAKQVLSAGIILGIVITCILIFIKPYLVNFFIPSSNKLAAEYMDTYLSLISYSAPASMIVQISAASLIAIGQSKSQMYISVFQIILYALLNMHLTPPQMELFGFKLHTLGWGISGSGSAYTFSMWVSAMIFLITVSRTKLGRTISFTLPTLNWLKRFFNISAPASVSWLLKISILMFTSWILKELDNGSVAIAAFRMGITLESICIMPAVGLAQAAGALAGQSLGMKDFNRANRIGWLAGKHGGIIAGIISVIIFIFAPNLAGWLIPEKYDVINEAVLFLRIICCMEVFQAYGSILTNVLQTAGDTRSPLYISFLTLWLSRLVLMFSAVKILELGSLGAWMVMSFTLGLYGIATIYIYSRGNWKNIKV